MRVTSSVLKVVGLLLCALALQVGTATAQKEGKDKDKDKDKETKKKFEIPKDAIEGAVKSIDMAKATFTITVNKKDRTFAVDKATEFWGPKGGDRGTGPAGLKDDCMAVGYQIHVTPTKDGKTAKDVFLPVRK